MLGVILAAAASLLLLLSKAGAHNITIAFPSLIIDNDVAFLQTLAIRLAESGENVTVFSCAKQRFMHPNIEYLRIHTGTVMQEYEAFRGTVAFKKVMLIWALTIISRIFWSDKRVLHHYKNNEYIDALIIPTSFNDYVLPLINNTNASLITYSPTGLDKLVMGHSSGNFAAKPVLGSGLPMHLSFIESVMKIPYVFVYLEQYISQFNNFMQRIVDRLGPYGYEGYHKNDHHEQIEQIEHVGQIEQIEHVGQIEQIEHIDQNLVQ